MAEAGWYQDTLDPSLARWWDGERWTPESMPLPASGDLRDVPPPSRYAAPRRTEPTAPVRDQLARSGSPGRQNSDRAQSRPDAKQLQQRRIIVAGGAVVGLFLLVQLLQSSSGPLILVLAGAAGFWWYRRTQNASSGVSDSSAASASPTTAPAKSHSALKALLAGIGGGLIAVLLVIVLAAFALYRWYDSTFTEEEKQIIDDVTNEFDERTTFCLQNPLHPDCDLGFGG